VIVDRDAHIAIVELAFELGPSCTFGDVDIRGVSGDLADAIHARVAFERGQPYSSSAIAETRRRLFAMGRFAMVRVAPDKTTGEIVAVHVTVTEGARNDLAVRGGFAIDPATYEVRGRFGYSIVGWPFALHTVALDLRPALAILRDGDGYQPRLRAALRMTRIDLFRPELTGEVELGYDYLVLKAYTTYGPRARLGLATPIGTPRVQLRIGWQLQEAAFTNLDPLIDAPTAHALGLDRSERVGAYEQTIVVDLRDNRLEPRDGVYAELNLEEGTRFALGNLEFIRVTPTRAATSRSATSCSLHVHATAPSSATFPSSRASIPAARPRNAGSRSAGSRRRWPATSTASFIRSRSASRPSPPMRRASAHSSHSRPAGEPRPSRSRQ
jgi:translocation and assembly module TamA